MPSSRYYRFKTISKEEKIKKIKILFFLFFLLAIILTVFWLIFLSSFLKIQNINFSDNTVLNRDNILSIISNINSFGLGENLLILSKSRLKSELAAAFPSITDITITKKLFNTITIDFHKRIQIGIWCNSAGCYYFDKTGVAFAKTPETEGSLILKIEDLSKNNILLGDKVLDDNLINFIFAFNAKISENNKFKILEFKIKPNFSVDLEAVTNKNWSIYLDEKQEPAAAVNNLLSILEEAVKNTGNLEYVDLRIPSRVFYKLK
ncbi:MAG: FtsQ-type POTRA domain-containing protein [Parcubacteria group bacterium]|nr:FtsQ-type POTRA domain-containing protein [Parcubacteria group bacterium]